MITPASETVLLLLTGTPTSAAMARSVVVQDSVGTAKLAVTTVADPAGTAVWYPANVRVLVGAAALRPVVRELVPGATCQGPGPWVPRPLTAADAAPAVISPDSASPPAAVAATSMRIARDIVRIPSPVRVRIGHAETAPRP